MVEKKDTLYKKSNLKTPTVPLINLQPEKGKVPEDAESRREETIYYLRIAFYICAILFIVSFLLETWGTYLHSASASRAASRQTGTEKKVPAVKVRNLKKYFPLRIIGYHTKGIKDIIGQEYPKAEAVYEPEDMNLQLRSPIVIYCQVVHFDDLAEAERFLQEKWREYPKNQQAIVFENTYASTGFKEDDSAYFLGTIYKSKVFWFKTSYVELVPYEPDRLETLKYHNEKVAAEVLKFIGQAESGIEQVQ